MFFDILVMLIDISYIAQPFKSILEHVSRSLLLYGSITNGISLCFDVESFLSSFLSDTLWGLLQILILLLLLLLQILLNHLPLQDLFSLVSLFFVYGSGGSSLKVKLWNVHVSISVHIDVSVKQH
jgi:hypothetical protein